MSIHERAINESQAQAVVAWRARRLVDAGVRTDLARQVAGDPAYDLHAVLELADRGCPVELALRILAPLDERDAHC